MYDTYLLTYLDFRSRDRDRDLDKMNLSALEFQDHGLEITTLDIGHKRLVNLPLLLCV